jgi:valyl-tRNA synthetase
VDRDLVVETTRPELLAACVALVAHPDDARYRDRVGTTATTPLYGVPVPVLAHRLADPARAPGWP